MQAYIANGGLPPHYRCEEMNRTQEEWYALGKQEISIRLYGLSYGLTCIFLYIPCIIVMFHQDMFKTTAYKLMLMVTFFDIFSLSANAVVGGILFMKGAVFCNYPNFIYFWGCIVMFAWPGTCITCFILGFSRLIDLVSYNLHEAMFGGKRILYSVAIIAAYALTFWLFSTPVCFNSVGRTWLWDPLLYPDGSHYADYSSLLLQYNNTLTVSMTLFTYIAFGVTFTYKHTQMGYSLDKKTKQIFAQCAIICTLNMILGFVYAVFQWVQVTWTLTFFALFVWQFAAGGNLLAFYGVNATIRGRVLALFGFRQNRSTISNSIGTKKSKDRSGPDVLPSLEMI